MPRSGQRGPRVAHHAFNRWSHSQGKQEQRVAFVAGFEAALAALHRLTVHYRENARALGKEDWGVAAAELAEAERKIRLQWECTEKGHPACRAPKGASDG